MTEFFTYIARRIATKKHASPEATAFTPFEKVRKVAVYIDPLAPDAADAGSLVRQFFGSVGKEVIVLCPRKKDISCFGWMKRKYLKDYAGFGEQLFISLDISGSFTSEYAARCSRASFKAGRVQLKGDVFDLVVCSPVSEGTEETVTAGQTQTFEAMKEYLKKVK